MKITEALKREDVGDIRISCGNRWLYWNEEDLSWVVREQKPYAKKSTVWCVTADEDLAVQVLLKDN